MTVCFSRVPLQSYIYNVPPSCWDGVDFSIFERCSNRHRIGSVFLLQEQSQTTLILSVSYTCTEINFLSQLKLVVDRCGHPCLYCYCPNQAIFCKRILKTKQQPSCETYIRNCGWVDKKVLISLIESATVAVFLERKRYQL